jgi:hypothetical protein
MSQATLLRDPPLSGVLVLDAVSWDDYSRLLRIFEDRPGHRLTYDGGTLEIMSPRLEHDDTGRFLGRYRAVPQGDGSA